MVADQQNAEAPRREWLAWAADFSQLLFHHRVWSNSLFLLIFAALMLGLCGFRAYIGLSTMRIYSDDAFAVLDGGWRLMNGQVPHRDFFSDLGPLVHYLTLFGLKLSDGGVQGLAYAQAAVGVALGIWAYVLSSSRLTPLARLLLCATIVLLTISPYLPGEPINHTTPACTYNRYGYAMMGLVMVEALCRRRSNRGSELRGGFSTGVIAGLLPFIKVSYLFGVGFLILCLFFCRPQTARRWMGIVSGFLAVIAAGFILLGGTFLPMLNDWRTLAGAKHLEPHWFMAEALISGVFSILILVLFAAISLRDAGAYSQARGIAITGLATAFLGLFFLSTNAQKNSLPLNGILAIIIFSMLTTYDRQPQRLNSLVRFAACWWSCLILLGVAGLDAAALIYGVEQKVGASSEYAAFDAPRLAGFRTTDGEYVDQVNDGVVLVQRLRQPHESIMSLEFTNPLSFTLGMKPARGGAVALKYKVNFDNTHGPSVQWLIGEAGLVAVPKKFRDYHATDTVPLIYMPYVATHFHLIGESKHWRLYRHNP